VPTIDTLQRDKLAGASGVLARAFDDDPVFRFLYPTPRRRHLACRGFLHSIARDALPFGEVWAAFDGVVVAAAGWLPEGTYPPTRWRAARLLMSAWSTVLTPHTFRDGLRYLSETEKLHPKEPHWYLAVIGVEPTRQGEGLGGKLLAAVLDPLDRKGIPAYLETSTEANVAWYRHHGFEVQNEVNPAPTGPPVWTMWREPKA
jgi:ribosomal protein S18 acetylase RimI-like enzyme